jgi:predicted SAM-dependent methyltransferase
LPFLDATNTSDWYRLFGDRKISAICAEQVWAHMTEEQGANALKNASDFLETGGHIRLAVPDGNFPSVEYLEWVRPGGNGPGADDHKTLYNVYSLSKLGESVGLIPTPLEFFDSSGRFNFVEWQTQDGFIGRSSRFDVRNALGRLNYSSLIIDFRKPQFSK